MKTAAGAVRRGVQAIGRGVRTGAQTVGRGLRTGAQAVGRGVRRGAAAVGRGLRSAGAALARTRPVRQLARAAAAVRAAAARGKQAYLRAKERFKAWRERRKREREARKKRNQDERLQKADLAVQKLLSRGAGTWTLPLRLAAIRAFYRLSSMHVADAGETIEITLTINPRKKQRAKLQTKKLHNGFAKVIGFGSTNLGAASLKVVEAAVDFFQAAVAQVASTGETDPTVIGKKAGAMAEQFLLDWSKSAQGVSGVRVGVEFRSAGGVPLGGRRWYGKRSSDARYARGRIIVDFKLSPAAQRPDQHKAFVRFAVNNGYTIVYVYAVSG
jgi:hypothetical protein